MVEARSWAIRVVINATVDLHDPNDSDIDLAEVIEWNFSKEAFHSNDYISHVEIDVTDTTEIV